MTRDWVDFKAVKESVSMQMVLDHYRINWLRKTKDELRGRCPIHKGKGERTFHVNVVKGAFNCFSCGVRGNVLDLVAAIEQCSVRDAALKLQSWFAVGESKQRNVVPDAAVEERQPESESIINPPLSFQLRVDPEHPYGSSRGVSKETLNYFGAGLCLSKGTFAGRFVIPLHNPSGEIVGYAGRSIDDREPRYLFPKNLHKRYLLFNLHRILNASDRVESVVVVEGFFGCFKVTDAGFPAVALLGSSLSNEQEELLCQHFKRIVLFFDGDDAGRAGSDDCLKRLGRRLWTRAIPLSNGAQPDQLSSVAIREILSGS